MPAEYRVGIVFAVIVVGGFVAAVVPLLTSGGGNPVAEVNGKLPERITVGQVQTVPLAVDNTGDAIIHTLCLRVSVDPPGVLAPVSAAFQGLETVAFSGDRVCGGSLSGQEVISVRLGLRGAATGGARVSIVAADGGRDIGPVLHGVVAVVAPGAG